MSFTFHLKSTWIFNEVTKWNKGDPYPPESHVGSNSFKGLMQDMLVSSIVIVLLANLLVGNVYLYIYIHACIHTNVCTYIHT